LLSERGGGAINRLHPRSRMHIGHPHTIDRQKANVPRSLPAPGENHRVFATTVKNFFKPANDDEGLPRRKRP